MWDQSAGTDLVARMAALLEDQYVETGTNEFQGGDAAARTRTHHDGGSHQRPLSIACRPSQNSSRDARLSVPGGMTGSAMPVGAVGGAGSGPVTSSSR